MSREELRGSLGRGVDPRAFGALVGRWQADGRVVADAATVRAADFSVQLNPKQQTLVDRIAEVYRADGFNAPSIEEVSHAVGAHPDAVRSMLRVGQDQGLFARIDEELYY